MDARSGVQSTMSCATVHYANTRVDNSDMRGYNDNELETEHA